MIDEELEQDKMTESSVVISSLMPGTGALCQSGQTAKVHYTGALRSNG